MQEVWGGEEREKRGGKRNEKVTMAVTMATQHFGSCFLACFDSEVRGGEEEDDTDAEASQMLGSYFVFDMHFPLSPTLDFSLANFSPPSPYTYSSEKHP